MAVVPGAGEGGDEWSWRRELAEPPRDIPPNEWIFSPPTYEAELEQTYGPQGGGGGGGGHEGPAALTMADILPKLKFPTRLGYYGTDVLRYFHDLITKNPSFAIPIPKFTLGGGVERTEEGGIAEYDVPEDVDAYVTLWQDFLDMLKSAEFGQAQAQQLVGLTYSPVSGWAQGVNIPLLPALEYL